MKITPSILRRSIKSIAIPAMAILFMAGCKDGEDPDPRETFNDTFETEDFDVLLTISSSSDDSLFTLTSNPEIEFDIDDDLQPDKMEIDLNEFITDVLEGTIGSLSGFSFLVNFEESSIVDISGGEFVIEEHEFVVTITDGVDAQVLSCDITVEGELVGDEVTFDFILILYTPTPGFYYQFEGTAVANRN